MSIALIPVVGAFSEDFGIEDISLAWNLKNGRVNAFREMEEGCRELIVNVPKAGWRKDGDGYSGLGSIILSGGSMADSDGKLYEKPVYMEELGDDDLDDVAGGEGSGYRSSVIAHLSYWCSYNDRITRFFNDHS